MIIKKSILALLVLLFLIPNVGKAVYRINLKDGYSHFTFYPHLHPELFASFDKYYWRGHEIKLSEDERAQFLEHDYLEKKSVRGINRAYLKNYISKKITPKVNLQGTGSIMKVGESGRVYFSDDVFETRYLDEDLTVFMIEKAIKENVNELELPVAKSDPELDIDGKLGIKGVNGIVAVGQSDFSDSSLFRIKNIKTAISKFNGLVIQPGEVFSFNKFLGSVNAKTGFVKELVIKLDGLTKEYGGGVCQVSSTMYRSAMKSGFPINQRRNHSFAVNHYEPQGSDATIYLGVQDFKFTNDYNTPIVIQGAMKGDIAYFTFFGNKDKRRSVKLFGPYISNYTNIPADIKKYTSWLAPGKTQIIQRGQKGFTSNWFRVINGTVERIVSKYKAIPSIYKIGIEG